MNDERLDSKLISLIFYNFEPSMNVIRFLLNSKRMRKILKEYSMSPSEKTYTQSQPLAMLSLTIW